MATDLNANEVAALKKAGFSPSQIRAFQLGKADANLSSQMTKALSPSPGNWATSFNPFSAQDRSRSMPVSGPNGKSMGTIWDKYGAEALASNLLNTGALGNPLGQPVAPVTGIPSKQAQLLANIPADKRGLKQTAGSTYLRDYPGANVPFDVLKTRGGTTYNSFGGPYGTMDGAPGHPLPPGWVPFQGQVGGDTPEIPGLSESNPFPDLGQVDVPVITPRDFTNEATGIADRVFAPLFADYEKQKSGATERGARNATVLSGLYNNLVSSIATEAANTANRYTGEQQATQQRGQELGASIGNAYGSSNDAIARLAGQMGGNAAAAAAPNAADSAWAQSMAGIGNKAQQDYVANQASSAADSAARRQDVARTTGVVAQENNMTNTGQDIANIESQIAGSRTKQGLTAIDIANQLASRDLSAQQANAGYSMQGQQLNNQNTLAAWEAGNAANTRSDQYNQWKYEQQRQQQQDEWNRMKDQAGLSIDIAKAGGQQAGAAPKSLDNYSGTDKVWASAVNLYGEDKGTKLVNLATNVAANSDAAKSGDMYGFIQAVVDQAPTYGLSAEEARGVAMNLWNNGLRQPTG